VFTSFREWCDRNPKPALGLGAGLFLIVLIVFVRSLSGPDLPVANSVKMVCVSSGKVFHLDREDINMYPMQNPKTGEYTLMPVEERNGRDYVPQRYKETVTSVLKDVNKYVDPSTLALKE